MTCPSCAAENDSTSTTCSTCGAALSAPSSFVVSVDLRPGTLFHSRYEILGWLGRGGMGMVYKARDRTLEETVAIKVLRPDIADDRGMAQRFKSEIKLARKVRHRNVCAIHDFGEERGLLFISMEFIDGVDLKQRIKEKGPLPVVQAFDVAIQIAEGLQAVHDAGIIHRDLKAPNIMLDAGGVARLMDFGVAKHEDAETATVTGHVIGTPDYMSPEQAQASKVDFRCDLYALGVVTFEMFTGRVPFKGDTPLSTLLKHVHEAPPLEGAAAAGIPLELRPVLLKALAKEPAHRYASAREMADAIRQAQKLGAQAATAVEPATLAGMYPLSAAQAASTPTLKATPPAPRISRPAPPRRPWLLPLAGLTLGGAALAAGLAWRGVSPTESSPLPLAPAAPSAPAPSPTSAPPTPSADAIPPSPVADPPTPVAARPTPRATPAPRPRPTTAATLPAVVAVASPPPPSRAPDPIPPSATPSVDDRTGLLQISVRPWGTVSVDGRLLGQTPLDKISLRVGSHAIRVEHPAYQPLEGQVTLRPGELSKVSFDFAKDGSRRER